MPSNNKHNRDRKKLWGQPEMRNIDSDPFSRINCNAIADKWNVPRLRDSKAKTDAIRKLFGGSNNNGK